MEISRFLPSFVQAYYSQFQSSIDYKKIFKTAVEYSPTPNLSPRSFKIIVGLSIVAVYAIYKIIQNRLPSTPKLPDNKPLTKPPVDIDSKTPVKPTTTTGSELLKPTTKPFISEALKTTIAKPTATTGSEPLKPTTKPPISETPKSPIVKPTVTTSSEPLKPTPKPSISETPKSPIVKPTATTGSEPLKPTPKPSISETPKSPIVKPTVTTDSEPLKPAPKPSISETPKSPIVKPTATTVDKDSKSTAVMPSSPPVADMPKKLTADSSSSTDDESSETDDAPLPRPPVKTSDDESSETYDAPLPRPPVKASNDTLSPIPPKRPLRTGPVALEVPTDQPPILQKTVVMPSSPPFADRSKKPTFLIPSEATVNDSSKSTGDTTSPLVNKTPPERPSRSDPRVALPAPTDQHSISQTTVVTSSSPPFADRSKKPTFVKSSEATGSATSEKMVDTTPVINTPTDQSPTSQPKVGELLPTYSANNSSKTVLDVSSPMGKQELIEQINLQKKIAPTKTDDKKGKKKGAFNKRW